jgi:hypothetical protein
VKDREFHDKHVYEWLSDPEKGIENEKKLGGVAVENEGSKMNAIAPKNYYIRTSKTEILKMKGIGKRNISEKNSGCNNTEKDIITADSFKNCINKNTPVNAQNCIFHFENDELVKKVVNKIGISGVHTKMIVLENNSCAPYIYNLKASNYIVK